MNRSQSQALFERAQKVIVGGVNSPVRAFRAVGGQPPFIRSAKGSRLCDEDDNELIDYVGTWGPAILGHADPLVVAAVQNTVAAGLSFGAPTALEVDLAEAVIEAYPSIELLRCVSSGTEATMSAIRVARGHTGRDGLIKFEGGYHGHADHLLVKAGSGLATFGEPDSAGVPEGVARSTLTLPYNDIAALEAVFTERGGEIAAVIVEPVAGNMGCIPPRDGFLEAIVSLCEKHGAVSIFDEVMCGFRVARGGAQERYGVRADVTALGKIVGGGMPLAVYGGRRDIMEMIAPLGPVYQAGTLSGNPAAVVAGLMTLRQLDAELYSQLEARGAQLEDGLAAAAAEAGVTACVQRVGSMITLFFGKGPIHDFAESAACDGDGFARFHQGMLARGIYWPPSRFEAAFISAAHTEDDIAQTIAAAHEALAAS
jgi:glutamate-1-semialdehyde 2,1-aminomutase